MNEKLVTASTDFNNNIILGHEDGSLSKIIKSGDDLKLESI